MLLDGLLASLDLDHTIDPSGAGGPLPRKALEQILALGHPLGAAVLANRRRAAQSQDSAQFPVTLRVTLPGSSADVSPTDYLHTLDTVTSEIDADEWQYVGQPAEDAGVDDLIAHLNAARALRSDLPIRAFTTDTVLAAARHDQVELDTVVARLFTAGLATFDWAPGSDADPATLDVHRAAHALGQRTAVALPYGRNALGAVLLDRAQAIAALQAETQGFATVVPLPDRTEGASPMEGTAGTEDVLVFALARLALCGNGGIPHVSLDAHVLGHKLGALLLNAGADDWIGAHAAATWPKPTNDAPRPLNLDRVTRLLEEARRTPQRRAGAVPA